jgi:hypothetical protein
MSGAVCFLWHFPSAGLEPGIPDVIRHTALRSSDFPPYSNEQGGRPVRLPTVVIISEAFGPQPSDFKLEPADAGAK